MSIYKDRTVWNLSKTMSLSEAFQLFAFHVRENYHWQRHETSWKKLQRNVEWEGGSFFQRKQKQQTPCLEHLLEWSFVKGGHTRVLKQSDVWWGMGYFVPRKKVAQVRFDKNALHGIAKTEKLGKCQQESRTALQISPYTECSWLPTACAENDLQGEATSWLMRCASAVNRTTGSVFKEITTNKRFVVSVIDSSVLYRLGCKVSFCRG